ncbi:14203_t:CDS:2 [Funneliformis geosporum]|uniref:14203_t:CDS:1 n=1 Tax=Funneliformis geosporum TaxID=1117311 RepID=A0A9W4SBA7_9GLOM|nr:14203_t:CDS:2 [Funneliformis geosporum]
MPNTNSNFVMLYQQCWLREPDERPDINQVISKLNSITILKKTEKDLLYFSTHKIFEEEPDHIPSRFELLDWIQKPFSKKIDIPKMIYELYIRPTLSEQDSNKFFQSSKEFSFRVMSDIIAIIYPPITGYTEDSFHSFWDAVIIKPINLACPKGKFNRNSSAHTSTKKLRPDFSYTLDGACLARGEEKGLNTYNDPAEELTSKLIWTYERCSYIFGYYARGFDVTYCYLYNEENKIYRKDLVTCDLQTLLGRINAFIIGINIGRLLPLIRKSLSDSFHWEFYTIHRPNSGKIIELMQNVVVKRYLKVDCLAKLEKIYREMDKKQVPYIDHIVEINKGENGRTPNIIFSPKGTLHKPTSEKQLVIALYCVLSALKVLHKIGYIHQDIRWENVLKYIDRNIWFIIDFEDASEYPALALQHLDKSNHSPEVFNDLHCESVDMWSVGYLIMSASVELPRNDILKIYAKDLMKGNTSESAEMALRFLWQNYREFLTNEGFIE